MDRLKVKAIWSHRRQKSVKFEDFFKILENFLKIFDSTQRKIEPRSISEKLEAIFSRILSITGRATLILSIIPYLIWIVVNYADYFGVLRVLPNISNNAFVVARFFILRRNSSEILAMHNDLRDIYEDSMKNHTRKARKYLTRSNTFQYIYCGILIFTQSSQVFAFIANYIQHRTEVFTVQMWLPFDHKSDLNYFMSCLVISWSGFFCTTALIVGDWTVYTIICVTSLEFEAIGHEMKTILNNPKVKLRDLSSALDHQNTLIAICNQLESIVSKSLLHNYLQGIAIICLTCFQLAILSDPLQLIIYGLVLIIVSSKILMLCFHGQMLIDASSSVAREIYDSDWHSIEDMQVKKAIPLLMQISHRAKCVTAFGFNRISIETLTLVRGFLDFNLIFLKICRINRFTAPDTHISLY